MALTLSISDDVATLLEEEAQRRDLGVTELLRQLILEKFGGSAETPREIPWGGMFHDPEMVSAEQLEENLAEGWADAIDRDRG